MKKLSETLKELGIAFTFPIQIRNSKGNETYFEDSDGYWCKREYNSYGKQTYFEDNHGNKRDTRNKTCDGRVVEIDGLLMSLN